MKSQDIAISELARLFEAKFGKQPTIINQLPASGGYRIYYRLSAPGCCAIGVDGNNLTENNHFIYLSSVLARSGCYVPEIYGVSDDGKYYLQQDLGTVSLFDIISEAQASGNMDIAKPLVCRCMQSLPNIQCAEIDYDRLCKPFDRRMILRDLNYFRYCMLKPSGVDPDEDLIDEDFYAMADALVDVPEQYIGFMYRDCQSRNVMLVDDEPYWIDYQGGRRGPVLYDVASFLWQARANFPDTVREAGISAYLTAYCAKRKDADAGLMHKALPQYLLLRMLQVLGAYGFRGLIEHRAHFILSIGPAIRNIAELVKTGVCDAYPELKKSLLQLVEIWDKRLKPSVEHVKENRLVISVFSFSYKKGYPADYSGNGGGFMFDCRGMHNPGRYEEYKSLTGRDKPVIDFLEQRGEVQGFIKSAEEIVDSSVETYIRRGFSSLQIGFGCTGGQHRSVYCAEAMEKHLKEKYPEAVVVLTHREQDFKQ